LRAFLAGASMFVLVNAVICLYRAIKGPTIQDRLLTLGIVGSSIVAILVLLSAILASSLYLDVATLLVLLSFIVMIVLSRYLETHGREVDDSDR
jgi:multicomponent Na+:H+ antiporter subunit F